MSTHEIRTNSTHFCIKLISLWISSSSISCVCVNEHWSHKNSGNQLEISSEEIPATTNNSMRSTSQTRQKKNVRRKTNCWEKQKVRLMSWTFSILYFMLYHWITAKVLSVHTTRVFHTNLDQPKYTLHENKCQIQIAKNMDKVKGLQLQWYWQNGSMRHSHQMINLKRLNTIFVP